MYGGAAMASESGSAFARERGRECECELELDCTGADDDDDDEDDVQEVDPHVCFWTRTTEAGAASVLWPAYAPLSTTTVSETSESPARARTRRWICVRSVLSAKTRESTGPCSQRERS